MDAVGLKESGLNVLARQTYKLMGLATFFTGGPDECRAWTIHAGDTAPKAAGVIHTDFEKGFIKAEAYTIDDLRQYGTEAKIKEDTQATIRCVPFAFEQTEGIDMVSGKPSKCRVLIARSY